MISKPEIDQSTVFIVDDGCKGANVVKDAALLNDTRSARHASVGGIVKGKSIKATAVGYLPFAGKTFVAPDAEYNVLSFRQLLRPGNKFFGDLKKKQILDDNGNILLTATERNGYYTVTYQDLLTAEDMLKTTALPTSASESVEKEPSTSESEVISNDKIVHLNKEERTRAEEAFRLCRNLNHPGLNGVINALKSGLFNTHLSPADVRNGWSLYGPCLACAEGKLKASSERASQSPPASLPGEYLHCDILPLTNEDDKDIDKNMLLSVDEKTSQPSR